MPQPGSAFESKRSGGLNRSEIAEVYQTYGHLIRRRCRTLLRSSALADDAMQEVFVSLIRYGGRLREADSKIAWLYRVTDRCCFAQFERQKKHEPVADTDTASDSVDTGDQVEDRNTVVRLLAQLDDKERQVAVMAYVDELSKEEIGRRLGWSRQTIHKKLKSIQAKAKSFKEHHHV